MTTFTDVEKKLMKDLVQQSIRYGAQHHRLIPIDLNAYPPNLQEKGACFITLTRERMLRGCIGSLEDYQPLARDIVHNAYAAAFEDPRFPPVMESEIPYLHIHISILSHPEPIAFDSEKDLLQKIRPNIDGLILTEKGYRGTFLPAVWESLRKPKEFLEHLKMKAGLPADYWSDTIQVERYTTEVIE